MRITVNIEGKRYDIEIHQLPFEDTVDRIMVNGKPVEVTVASDWDRQFSKSLITGGRSYQVEFELDARKLPRRVFAMGRSVDVELDFPGMGKLNKTETLGVPGDGKQIRAPLPGKIITLKVRPGQTVKPGDLLCLLEAMKMENEVISPRTANVSEVLVKEGDSVEGGQVLVVLD